MSYYLDLLAGPQRVAECQANDLLFQQEQPMRHPVHVGRVFADMESSSEAEDGAEYEITLIRFGKPQELVRRWFPNSNAASLEAASLSSGGAVALVRPASDSAIQ